MKYSELATVGSVRARDNQSATHIPKELICFSHLRWDFVYQRPQHLLTRFAEETKVTVFEEPVFEDNARPHLRQSDVQANVLRIIPVLPHGLSREEIVAAQEKLVRQHLRGKARCELAFWYYTPMALEFTRGIRPGVVIYDVMDELAAFKFAPPQLVALEDELYERADVVFTGGHSLYQSKLRRHHNVHCFPSSIDFEHFAKARNGISQPADQTAITGPRLGFFGVVDERFDIELLRSAAALRPDYQFIIIGPVVKIDEADLPRAANIHYLGKREYQELPAYLKGWDIALIPFADNESTRFISPTKTPEYLAAGKPVISTPIRDVVTPYAEEGLVHIANNGEELVRLADKILADSNRQAWLDEVDAFLQGNSWDDTYQHMLREIERTLVV